jgi:hypothetical protein
MSTFHPYKLPKETRRRFHCLLSSTFTPEGFLSGTRRATSLPGYTVCVFRNSGTHSHGDLDRVISLGYGFISADYQLLPPATAHDIVKDIQDAFSFITGNIIEDQNVRIKGDPDRLAVAGSSAGGLCAYLAAIHASPKPKALLSIYGMGGNFFVRSSDSLTASLLTNFLQVCTLPCTKERGFLPW